jgi:hypothetical protein
MSERTYRGVKESLIEKLKLRSVDIGFEMIVKAVDVAKVSGK